MQYNTAMASVAKILLQTLTLKQNNCSFIVLIRLSQFIYCKKSLIDDLTTILPLEAE